MNFENHNIMKSARVRTIKYNTAFKKQTSLFDTAVGKPPKSYVFLVARPLPWLSLVITNA